MAREIGVDWESIITALSEYISPKGRFQELKSKRGVRIVVDFAHTPNSLESVLESATNQTNGKVICVFGCAGERDIEKRKMMGEISATISDVSIFTTEDPRGEDVTDILQEMKFGAKKTRAREIKLGLPINGKDSKKSKFYILIPNRLEAILYAVRDVAKKGDLVLICGKGHEKSMAYENTEHPWSDENAVDTALNLDDERGAIVLAAGKGTRLRPLTFQTPKCLVPICGKPLLDYWFDLFELYGIDEILINTSHLAGTVEKHIKDHSRDLRIKVVYEEVLLGSGGTIKKNRDFVTGEESFFIFYADNLTDINLHDMIETVSFIPSGTLKTYFIGS